MDLTSKAIHDIVLPTAAFIEDLPSLLPQTRSTRAASGEAGNAASWETSSLNPKNRIDSLGDLPNPLWRIDGCTGLGTQFFAVPLFLKPAPPVRVDVFIPEQPSPELRALLQLNDAFHTKDRFRVSGLAITKFILRKLEQWTKAMPDPASWYMSLPFGSRIIFESLCLNLEDIRIRVVPMHNLERQLKSPETLERMWEEESISLPPQVSLDRLEIVEQLHDSVCVVRLNDSKVLILKALTSYPKYLYLELRNLLRIAPHNNIIGRPSHVVTKRCRFGNKNAVVGFLVEYHQSGSLRDMLPYLRAHNALHLADQVRWSIQVTKSLIHLHETCGIFYPDLRLENLVVSNAGDIVMVDFEQRGVWCEFSAPEVNFLEYVLTLARSDDIPESIREAMEQRICELLPYEYDRFESTDYDETLPSFNVTWLCLRREEQEMAVVFMLGRLLWCIFEGVSAPQQAAVWQSYKWESELDFPEYRRTPPEMRRLVDRCTRGRRPSLSRRVGRVGSKLAVVREDGSETQTALDEIRTLAQQWWRDEIEHAEKFLDERKGLLDRVQWDGNPFGRPKLEEVLDTLEEFGKGLK